MDSLDLSIVIINFNTPQLTKQCVDSIIKYCKGINYEIIVVDNASTDDSVKRLEKIKQSLLLRSKINLGFAGGNNLGIHKAKGKYVLLLNSDTIINSKVLQKMVDWMDNNPKVGISTCSLLNEDGSIQGTGGYFPSLFKVFAWMSFIDDIPFLDTIIKPFHPMHSKSPYKGFGFYGQTRELDWVTGAFMLTRREVFDNVGLLDEDYFMYVEDVDFAYRAKKSGWKVAYLPKFEITHLGGKSSNKEFPIISEFTALKQFYKKHYPAWQYPILRFLFKLGSLPRIILFGKTYVKAFKTA